jgi:hypothetical protein
MLARALIVLLAVANLGVTLWWALQPAASAPAIATDSDDGAPRLRLIGEATSVAPPAPTSVAPVAAVPTSQCYTFGPFDADGYATARAHLQAQVETTQLRAEDTSLARGWRVWLPGQPDRVAANALAARIAAAGFRDYFVMSDGGEPNAIALGRFRSEGPAQERAQALQAAGFPAQAEPLLPASAARWLDLRAGTGFDVEAQRVAMGAAQAQPLDCTRLPAPSR